MALYTFDSHCHKSHSRIDMFLIANAVIEQVVDCKIKAMVFSDHAEVQLNIYNSEEKR